MAFNKSIEAVTAEADAFARLLDNGSINIYDGSQPATTNTAIVAQNLLLTLPIEAVSAPAAVDGVISLDVTNMIATATGAGTASWARAFKANGTSAVFDCTVGETATDMLIDSATIQIGNDVKAVAPFDYTVPKA